MSTQKPLSDLVPEILSYINVVYSDNVEYNRKLLDIHEGQLMTYVEESMQNELSPEAFARAKERIAPINILSNVVEKLSRVYVDPANRKAANGGDNELLNKYEEWYDIDNKMALANELMSLHKYFALEPYLSDGKPKLRVIPADKFLVWSDDKMEPTNPTVFIKFMGTVKKVVPATDNEGRARRDGSKVVREVSKFHLYSDDEFLEVDMDGDITIDEVNPFGRIPFVYGNSSPFNLIPKPDSDTFSMAILIPKLLADLNYAVQFQSHSIVYGIDIDPENLEGNPDSFWVINSKEGENKNPTLGTIKPDVDSDKVMELIHSEISLWLNSKGLKTSTSGNADVNISASGISKLIDEADATSIRKKQARLFNSFEKDLWSLTEIMHNIWVAKGVIEGEGKAFTSKFDPEILFADQKPVINKKEMLEEFKLMKELGLFIPKRAIAALHPTMTSEQVDEFFQELNDIESETNENIDRIFTDSEDDDGEEN